jgi:hypothetical protein
MYKILAFLILIPSLAFADVMIYFVASPAVVANRLQNLRARPDLGAGVKAELLDQAIIVATDNDITKVCYAVLIPDALLSAARLKPQFRGKGLIEVKDNFPAIYARIAQRTVRLLDDTVVRQDMADALPVGAVEIAKDQPLHTFAGYDPWTGELE